MTQTAVENPKVFAGTGVDPKSVEQNKHKIRQYIQQFVDPNFEEVEVVGPGTFKEWRLADKKTNEILTYKDENDVVHERRYQEAMDWYDDVQFTTGKFTKGQVAELIKINNEIPKMIDNLQKTVDALTAKVEASQAKQAVAAQAAPVRVTSYSPLYPLSRANSRWYVLFVTLIVVIVLLIIMVVNFSQNAGAISDLTKKTNDLTHEVSTQTTSENKLASEVAKNTATTNKTQASVNTLNQEFVSSQTAWNNLLSSATAVDTNTQDKSWVGKTLPADMLVAGKDPWLTWSYEGRIYDQIHGFPNSRGAVVIPAGSYIIRLDIRGPGIRILIPTSLSLATDYLHQNFTQLGYSFTQIYS